MPNMIEELGKRIKELQESKGISQTNVVKEFKLTYTAISRWETGVRTPTLEDIIMLAKFFDVTTDYILGLQDF